MTNSIFYRIVEIFKVTSRILCITYQEANVFVYCFIIPLTWTIMIDSILNTYFFTTIFSVISFTMFLVHLRLKDFTLEVYCKLVQFLLNFKSVGISYEKSSIIFCLIIPGSVYLLLTILLLTK